MQTAQRSYSDILARYAERRPDRRSVCSTDVPTSVQLGLKRFVSLILIAKADITSTLRTTSVLKHIYSDTYTRQSVYMPVILPVSPGDCPADFCISQLRFAESTLRFGTSEWGPGGSVEKRIPGLKN